MIARIVVVGVYWKGNAADRDVAELGEGCGGEGSEVVDEMLGGEQVVGGVFLEEGEGFGVDLVGGEEEGRRGEGRVDEGEGAEVGGVDLVAEFGGESEEAGEGLCDVSSLCSVFQKIGEKVLAILVQGDLASRDQRSWCTAQHSVARRFGRFQSRYQLLTHVYTGLGT